MVQRAVSGVGTTFRKWDGAAWLDIAQVMSITGPGITKETIDVTALDTEGGYRKFIGSFRDGGDVALTMNYTRDGLDQMKLDYDSECPVDYEIVIPDGNRDDPACTTSIDEALNTTFQFKGVVTELPIAITTDSQITMDVTIKVSGKVIVEDGEESTTPTYA